MDRISEDRRTHQRYALQMPLRYFLVRKGAASEFGRGVTLDLSSGGVCFAAESEVPVGSRLDLLIDWPAAPAADDRMELRILGEVVRSDDGKTGLQILRHRFIIHRAVERQVQKAVGSRPRASDANNPGGGESSRR